MESFSSFSDCWTYGSFKNFGQISPVVQTNLKQLYVSLCCVCIAVAMGAYLHILWNIGGLLTTFTALGCMCLLFATAIFDFPYEEPIRDLLLMVYFLLEGVSLGPIIKLAISFDTSILVNTFMGGAIAYACFSGAATVARRRELLYLGALLSSGVSIFFWLHFASKIFGGDIDPFQFEHYFGLLVFVGYMVVHTQVIIEKAHLGVGRV